MTIALTITPTDEIVEVMPASTGTVPMRIWRGITEKGTEVVALIMAVSPQTHDESKLEEFSELTEIVGPDNYT